MRKSNYKRFSLSRKPAVLRYYENPRKTRFKKILYTAVIIFISYFFLSGDRGLVKLVKLKRERSAINNDISKIQDEIDKKRKEKEAYQNDMDLIEKIARRDLGLVKKGEVIYKFIPSDQKKQAEEKK